MAVQSLFIVHGLAGKCCSDVTSPTVRSRNAHSFATRTGSRGGSYPPLVTSNHARAVSGTDVRSEERKPGRRRRRYRPYFRRLHPRTAGLARSWRDWVQSMHSISGVPVVPLKTARCSASIFVRNDVVSFARNGLEQPIVVASEHHRSMAALLAGRGFAHCEPRPGIQIGPQTSTCR